MARTSTAWVLLAVVGCILPRSVQAQIDLPARASAALHIYPDRLGSQSTVDRAFGLHDLVGLQAAPARLGRRTERVTLYTVRTADGWTVLGVTKANMRAAPDFQALRGEPAGSAGGHALYTYRSGAGGRLALVGRDAIAEGTVEALHFGLQDAGGDAAAKARAALARELRRGAKGDVAATLVYVARSDGASLVQIVTDLGAIWGPHMVRTIEPYDAVLGLLGSMRGARADVWQAGADLRVRIVLVAEDAGAAKRSHLALRTARGLAPMASKAAVGAGSMSATDAQVLSGVLRSMQSHVDGDRIYVELQIPGSIVQ